MSLPDISVLQARSDKRKIYNKAYSHKHTRKYKREHGLLRCQQAKKRNPKKLSTSYDGNPLKVKRFRIAVVRYLMSKQSSLCSYCGMDITHSYQIDHIQPLSLGGTHGLSNLCLACPTCNRAKWDMPLDAFKSWIEQLRS